MEIQISYSPSGKTKYFNVEVVGRLVKCATKRAAQILLEVLSEFRTQSNDTCQAPTVRPTEGIASDNTIEELPRLEPTGTTKTVPSQGVKYTKPVSVERQHHEVLRRLDEQVNCAGEAIGGAKTSLQYAGTGFQFFCEVFSREAKQHRENALQLERLRDDLIPALFGVGQHLRGDDECFDLTAQISTRPVLRLISQSLDTSGQTT